MRVAQTVFGVFHHFELARQLLKRGHLQQVYSTWPWARLKREGIPHEYVSTFPWVHTPEMLMHRFHVTHPYLLDQMGYLNALTFDRWCEQKLRATPPTSLIAISGSSLRTGRALKQQGTVFVCDRGSSHQRYQEVLVSEEFRVWGISRAVSDPRDTEREEEIYALADAITVPSHFAARSFVEQGVRVEKVHVIPYGVRLESFKQTRSPPKDAFMVLFAGAVGLRKGFPYLLEAFSKLTHPGKLLRVAGAIQPEMEPLLGRLPRDRVELLGVVGQERLAELMSTSHVMVLPSIEEGLALVQGQAMACGCPVIASTNTGAEDLFTDGVEGFVIPIRDSEAIREKLQTLADDTTLQHEMSNAALLRVRRLGGWDDYGDRWETLLNSLSEVPPPTK